MGYGGAEVLCPMHAAPVGGLELGVAREPSLDDQARAVGRCAWAPGSRDRRRVRRELANPELALAFLAGASRAQCRAGARAGLERPEFTRVAGAIEVLFGLLLISGALPQAGGG